MAKATTVRSSSTCCTAYVHLLLLTFRTPPLIHRTQWHATTGQEGIKWTENLFTQLFNTTDLSAVTLADFGPAVARAWTSFVDPNPRTREFAGIHRGPDGKFSDDDLAKILQDATEETAGSYRARGTPDILRLIEVMAMEQGRAWGVCTMNEFRDFLGLKRFGSFEEWNEDPEIAVRTCLASTCWSRAYRC